MESSRPSQEVARHQAVELARKSPCMIVVAIDEVAGENGIRIGRFGSPPDAPEGDAMRLFWEVIDKLMEAL